MRRLRFILSLFSTFIARFKVFLLLGLFLGVSFFFSAKVLMPRLFPKNIEYIGIVGRYHPDELPASILSLIGQGLTSIDATGKPVPALAESFHAEESGKTWVFKINTQARWHDGSSVTSGNIQYSFDDVEVLRPDGKTLIFKLKNAYAPFATVVSRSTFKQGLVGTGEWKVNRLSILNSYVDKLELINDSGTKKVMRFFPTEDAAKTAFKLGNIDKLEEVFDVTPFDTWETAEITPKAVKNQYVGIFFNTNTGIFKDNKSLRQALAYAIDKTIWKDVRVLSPIPENSWAYNPQVKPYEYDLTRAKDLLQTAGVKETVSFTLVSSPQLLSVAEKVSKDWQALGVQVKVSATNTLPEDYAAYLALYNVPDDPDQYQTWHSTLGDTTNITRFANPRIDKLLEDGRLEMDQEKRKKIYLDFQRFLLEDVPAVFLYHPTYYTVVRK